MPVNVIVCDSVLPCNLILRVHCDISKQYCLDSLNHHGLTGVVPASLKASFETKPAVLAQEHLLLVTQ